MKQMRNGGKGKTRKNMDAHYIFIRWDAQRIREQIQSEQLRKRYMPKEGSVSEKKKEKFTSFLPRAEECT